MSGEDDWYRVIASGAVREEIERLAVRARDRGQLRAFLDAFRWADDELHRTPREFGESRGTLKTMNFALRVAYVRPLQIEFAIHEPTRSVYYRRICLLDR